jgi:enoyl-CoA hydratase/carnithine racemase
LNNPVPLEWTSVADVSFSSKRDSLGPIAVRSEQAIAYIEFNRPDKRNAINDEIMDGLTAFVAKPPPEIRCVVLSGAGGNFSSGLDLTEQVRRQGAEVFHHSRNWHRTLDSILNGGLPFVSCLSGAVMGGGLEIAAACHVRVAETGVQFRMPEGERGIFVGGGATANVSRLIGPSRLTEMMLTGRTLDAQEALSVGLIHYVANPGEAMPLATALARRIAQNSRFINSLIIQGISRISDMSRADGLFAESLAAALSTTSADAAEGLNAFLEKRKPLFE